MIETRLDKNFKIKGFFDEETSTISYVVYDMTSKKCAVIDSVLDFDFSSGTIDSVSYTHLTLPTNREV